MLNLLLNLNLSSFSSLFELSCAFNFGYATIKPIREGIQKNTREELKKRFREDNELSFLTGIAQDLDNGNKITFPEMEGKQLKTFNLVIKVINTIREGQFDIKNEKKEEMFSLYFFEKTESLFLFYGVLAMFFLFIGGITNDFYTSLGNLYNSLDKNAQIEAKSLRLRTNIGFCYDSVFSFAVITFFYSFYIFFTKQKRGIKMSKTIISFFIGLLLSGAFALFSPQNINQSVSTISALVVLVTPYILFFIIPIIRDNITISNIIKSIDENKEEVLFIISAIANKNVKAESVRDFKEILEQTLNKNDKK